MLRHTTLRIYLLFHLWVTCFASSNDPRIIIVGAGPSGIAAASKLFENGFENVTILEAEDRVGGRVYTTKFDDYLVDMGGEYVHGEDENVSFEMAWPLGLLDKPDEEFNADIYDSKGQGLPTAVSRILGELYLNISEESTEDFDKYNGSVGDYFVKELTSRIEKNPTLKEANVSLSQISSLFEHLENAQDAADTWYESSVRGHREYKECSGNQAITWIDRGYGTILEILMKRFPNPEEELPVLNNTLLSTEVSLINYNHTDNTILISTSSGEEYVADHVIVTPSLGVLKEQYETLFVPQLPEYKAKAIRGLSMGTVAKIFLSFEEPWWPEGSGGFAFVWNDEDKSQMQSDPDKKWLLDLFGFFTKAHKPRLLCGWMTGPGVREMEKVPDDQVLTQVTDLLKRFVGKSYNVTMPSGMLRSQWYSNKHFRGTYSYRSMETERANVWADQLAEPLMIDDKPVVMFAGEATNPHHFSTVNGAIETGWREADRLIKIYHKRQ